VAVVGKLVAAGGSPLPLQCGFKPRKSVLVIFDGMFHGQVMQADADALCVPY
jgi:hypothetical protein